MGFRYRKSINLGGGFRVNFSKSGVGYSWGRKGYRITKTAKGRTRTTTSIPGTGLSWVNEQERKNTQNPQPRSQPQASSPDSVYAYSIENATANEMVPAQLEDFIDAIKRYRNIHTVFNVFLVIFLLLSVDTVFLIFFCAVLAIKLIYRFAGRIPVIYEYDSYGQKQLEQMQQIMTVLSENHALWQVNDVYNNQRTRVHAGAGRSLARTAISVKKRQPPFLLTNTVCYSINLKKEKLYILPDKILVTQGSKVGAVPLSELNISFKTQRFIEDSAPKDATILGYTWQYVNNNGTPDRRFKNNRQLPICNYGSIELNSSQGFNTMLHCSNISTVSKIQNILK